MAISQPPPSAPTLLARVREVLRLQHYALTTERTYVHWIRIFVRFHGRQHPRELSAAEIEQFLTWLAVDRKVSPRTQDVALNGIVFLYAKVLACDPGRFDGFIRAKPGQRIPVVLSRGQARRLSCPALVVGVGQR